MEAPEHFLGAKGATSQIKFETLYPKHILKLLCSEEKGNSTSKWRSYFLTSIFSPSDSPFARKLKGKAARPGHTKNRHLLLAGLLQGEWKGSKNVRDNRTSCISCALMSQFFCPIRVSASMRGKASEFPGKSHRERDLISSHTISNRLLVKLVAVRSGSIHGKAQGKSILWGPSFILIVRDNQRF